MVNKTIEEQTREEGRDYWVAQIFWEQNQYRDEGWLGTSRYLDASRWDPCGYSLIAAPDKCITSETIPTPEKKFC